VLNNDEIQTKLDRLASHKSRIELTFHRSLKELKALQTTAALRSLIPSDIAESVPPLASTREIAKQTQSIASNWPLNIPPHAFELEWVDPAASPAASLAVAG
jgi:hypothetical protein